MNFRKVLWIVLLALLVTGCFAQSTPKITISSTRISTSGHVIVQGSGFTPKANISSHLRKPDGNEYPVLPILTDDQGHFTHDIETLVLTVGVHELWVVDDASRLSSNRVQFEVTN